MFISIPEEFFVPVLFNEDFRHNFESNTVEYDTEARSVERSAISSHTNREKLADIDYIDDIKQDGEITSNYMENIKDKWVEDKVVDYIQIFWKFIYELEEAKCLEMSVSDSLKLINQYGMNLRQLYNSYIKDISSVRMPLHSTDVEGFVDRYIGKIEDMYNKVLGELKCTDLNYDAIEGLIVDIADDIRNILKEEIRNLNCNLVNKESSCKNYNDIENTFMTSNNFFNTIDDEFLNEIKK